MSPALPLTYSRPESYQIIFQPIWTHTANCEGKCKVLWSVLLVWYLMWLQQSKIESTFLTCLDDMYPKVENTSQWQCFYQQASGTYADWQWNIWLNLCPNREKIMSFHNKIYYIILIEYTLFFVKKEVKHYRPYII